MVRRAGGWFLLAALALARPGVAAAAEVSGRVTLAGSPVPAAMVTAREERTGIEITVFSSADGSYRIEALRPGAYRLAAKWPGHRGIPREVELAASGSADVALGTEPDPDFRRTLPSAYWLDLLPDGADKREFVLNCASCHEISHDRVLTAGRPRSAPDWLAAITLMRSIDVYGLTPPDFEDARFAAWLEGHLDAEAIAGLSPAPRASGAALAARITEYPVPRTPSLPHDLVIGPDGRVYVTAFYNDAIWAMDPDTGSIETYPVNEEPEVMGQVRALTFDSDGLLWVLLGGTRSVARLDPRSGDLQTFPVGMYPHSIEVDSAGRLWFNDYISASERIGRIDPKGGALSLYPIPDSGLGENEGLPLLYGLQVDRDDVVWGTMLAANKLFRFDPRSGAATLFDMPEPNSGPRRPGLGSDGSVWIPEFNTGVLTRFDPASGRFSRHELGGSGVGPYDVAVDQRTGHVWVTGSLASSLIRFDPGSGTVDHFPMPTEPAYGRHIAIDPERGDVWTAYSSMPDATPKIVRIELGRGAAGP